MNTSASHFDLRLDQAGLWLEVTQSIPDQGITVIGGPSGAGKTSLLRCLVGLNRAQGHVCIQGRTWQDNSRFVPVHQRSLGVVFQDPGLFAHLDVAQNIAFASQRAKCARQPIIWRADVAEALGIARLMQRRTWQLSGGEQQRVAIARALAVNPALLVMDEPLAALDMEGKGEILSFLRNLVRQHGLQMLWVTHSDDELLRLADHVLLMQSGRILAANRLDDLSTGQLAPGWPGKETGMVYESVVQSVDGLRGLCQLKWGTQSLWVAQPGLTVGRSVRIRILARDVGLSVLQPVNSSVLNRLPGRIVAIRQDAVSESGMIEVACGSVRLLAHAGHWAEGLASALAPGSQIWLQLHRLDVFD